MSDIKNRSTINQLAQRYADGELDRASYLKLREETLEKLVTESKSVPKAMQTDKSKESEVVNNEKKSETLQQASPPPQSTDSIPYLRIAIVTLILLLAFISAVYLLFIM